MDDQLPPLPPDLMDPGELPPEEMSPSEMASEIERLRSGMHDYERLFDLWDAECRRYIGSTLHWHDQYVRSERRVLALVGLAEVAGLHIPADLLPDHAEGTEI